MKIFRYIILMALVVATTSCIQLGESVVPNQYFVLESMPISTDIISNNSLIVTIELIDFPEYLKRPQVVVQSQENIIRFTDTKRWATPLEDQVKSLLSDNLELLLPYATINVSPWQSTRQVDHNLQISIRKLSGMLGHQSDIDIRWHIVDKNGGKRSGQYVDQRPIDDSYEGLVRALNRGLEGLSEELAKALVTE